MTTETATSGLLARVLHDPSSSFAMVQRPSSTGAGYVELLAGQVTAADMLDEIDITGRDRNASGERADVLLVVPYRQIRERGFAAVDDSAELLALHVADQESIPIEVLQAVLPDDPTPLADGGFDIDDEAYVDKVKQIITDEIGRGEGSNFVVKRSYVGRFHDYSIRTALALYRRLLTSETGAYWTFLVRTPGQVLVGASPERHVSSHGDKVVMNPISGTYRYPPSGPTLSGVVEFLADDKETEELYMVVDEELKMMARLCTGGGRVVGPFLKEMTRLAHTEYYIEGWARHDPRRILRETLLAPTVVGSPLENACRVIARHEPAGRGYYSGLLALIGRDESGATTLDSAILIRTAAIDDHGHVEIGVGATLVRHSDAVSEVAETHAKAAGLLALLDTPWLPGLADRQQVRDALARRNTALSSFWLAGDDRPAATTPWSHERHALVVDAEDTFTAMLGHQLEAMGLAVTVRDVTDPTLADGHGFDEHDLVVLGPGPGDPRDRSDPKIAGLRRLLAAIRTAGAPVLAVCLSHQVLCAELGLSLERLHPPNQGHQQEIDLFGHRELVGFYNTFIARADHDRIVTPRGRLELSRDQATGAVHALRGPQIASMQFHPESILTRNGYRLTHDRIAELLGGSTPATGRAG